MTSLSEPIHQAVPPSGPAPGPWSRANLRRSLPRLLLAAILAIVWVAVTAGTNPTRWPSKARFLAWIGLILLSFWGWGTLAARAFRAEAAFRGFLRMGLGMVALLAVAGVLLAAHLLAFPALVALVVVGAATQIAALGQDARRLRARLPVANLGFLVAAALVLGVALLRLIGSAKAVLPWWDADDTPAYWAFIRELTQRGSFDQAFSLRRMASFGGQTVLQAVVGLGVPIRSINVFDDGICPLLMAGVLLQVGYGQWLAVAAALLVAGTPTIAANSGAAFSGSLLLLVLYFALRFATEGDARRGGALAGLAAGAVVTLRHSFLPGCAVVLAAAAYAHFRAGQGRPLRERLGFAMTAALACAALVAPFSLASLIASHTPLFPLFKGYYLWGPTDLGGDGSTWLEGLKRILDNTPPMPQIAIVLMAVLALGSRLSRGALAALALGALVSTVALAKSLPNTPGDDLRYLAGPWIGLAAALYSEAVARPRAGRVRDHLLVSAVAVVLVALQLATALPHAIGGMLDDDRVRTGWTGWEGERDARDTMLELQAHVPRGRPLLAACDVQYYFDFRRNKIVLIDLPGVAGPFPLPGENATAEEYEEAIARFQRLGIDYLIFTDPALSHTMYSAPRWESFRGDGYRPHDFLVPRFAAWFGFERYVAAHRPILARAGKEELASLR